VLNSIRNNQESTNYASFDVLYDFFEVEEVSIDSLEVDQQFLLIGKAKGQLDLDFILEKLALNFVGIFIEDIYLNILRFTLFSP